MPVFHSAYDTTFGRRYVTESTKAAIAKAAVSNYLNKSPDLVEVIETNQNMPIDIPSFSHPIYLDTSVVNGIYVDGRQLTASNRQSGEVRITALSDYNFLKARGGLEKIWREDGTMVFRSMVYPASVYAQWIAENIQRQYGLEPENQFKLTVFAAWFYFSLFTDEEIPDDRDYAKVCQLISKATNVPIQTVMTVLDGQAYVKDVVDFCARLEEVTGSVQLRNFSSIVLYPLLNSTWFSVNSTEIVPVAIEHIPTFMAMCVSAVTEHAYNRSKLSKMAERVPAKNNAHNFVLQVTAMLK